MDDFFAAGGLKVVLQRLAEKGLLNLDAPTIEGGLLAHRLQHVECFDDNVIRTFDNPIVHEGGLAVLKGNIAPDGAILKTSAASSSLLRHRARIVVFNDIDDYNQRIDDPNLDVHADDILVLRNCGPRGYPGMPEVGNFRIPTKLASKGVRDMVRLTDARMSGTAFGTIALHIAPEAAVGGPLALLRTGDVVCLDVPARRLDVELLDSELQARRSAWSSTLALPERGYARLYYEHVLQANEGADFDFLAGSSGAAVPRDST
jgi:dihydroxy-acid dehydratase